MNIWFKSLVAGLCVALLFFFFSDRLGLINKIQKTNRLKYIAVATPKNIVEEKLSESQLATTANIIQSRITAAGFKSSSSIVREEADSGLAIEIIIENVKNAEIARELITSNGVTQIWETYEIPDLPGFFDAAEKACQELYPAPVTEKPIASKKDSVAPEIKQLLDSMEANKNRNLAQGLSQYINFKSITAARATLGIVRPIDSTIVGKILRSPTVTQSIPSDARYCFGEAQGYDEIKAGTTKLLTLYMLRTHGRDQEAMIDNDDISDAAADFETDGRPAIFFKFTSLGTKTWENMTERNTGKVLAIVVNGKVLSAPVVEGKISGSESRIHGDFSVEQAQSLAAQLKGTPLPAKITILTEQNMANKSPVPAKKWVFTCIAFAVSFGLAWFVFKTLKST